MAGMSVIGIDFGNESCYIGVARAGGIETIANDYSLRATPSFVAFGHERNRMLGVNARDQWLTNCDNTIYGFKRLLGRKYTDSHVQNELKNFAYKVTQLPDNGVGIKVKHNNKEKIFTPEQMTAMLFTKLKEVSETALKSKVNDCVISVPSWFTNTERKALLDAAQIANLNVLRLLNETTATALYYGIYKQDLPNPEESPRNVVFVDCGHSSLQVAVCAFNKGKLKMLASCADPYLGGRDFDNILTDYFCKDIEKRYKIDPRAKPRTFLRLLTEVEKLKKLMSANSTRLPMVIEYFYDEKDVQCNMMRSEMEQLCSELLKKVEKTLTQCLEESKLSIEDIHSVEIVGGGTRVPAIKQLIEQVFCKGVSTTLNQNEAVARGCALQCALLSPAVRVKEFSVADIHNYPVKLVWDPSAGDDGQMEVFPKFHQMPFSKKLTFFRKENFPLKAYYNSPVPYPESLIGEFIIKDVKPTPEGESSKIKVKVRVNIHGIVAVVSASMTEKKDSSAMDVESQEQQSMETDNKPAGDSNENASGEQNATSNPQDNGDVEMEENEKKDSKKKSSFKVVELPIEDRSPCYSLKQINECVEAECEMIAVDRQEKATADAKNALEEYIYDLRAKLSEDLEPFVVPSDKDKLLKTLDDMENWLYSAGEDCSIQEYVKRLNSLKDLGEPIRNRKVEFETRSGELVQLGRVIQLGMKFLDLWKEGSQKFGHISPEEVAKVEEAVSNSTKWLDEKTAVLDRCPKTQDAPVSTQDIRNEKQNLDKVISSIAMKPKPAAPAPEANKTENDTGAQEGQNQPPPSTNKTEGQNHSQQSPKQSNANMDVE